MCGMKTNSSALKIAGSVCALMLSFDANAWMDQWAPEFKAAEAIAHALPEITVSNYVCTAIEGGEFKLKYDDILHQTKIQTDRTHGRRPEENRR